MSAQIFLSMSRCNIVSESGKLWEEHLVGQFLLLLLEGAKCYQISPLRNVQQVATSNFCVKDYTMYMTMAKCFSEPNFGKLYPMETVS